MSDDLDSLLDELRKEYGHSKRQKATKPGKPVPEHTPPVQPDSPIRRTVAKSNGRKSGHREADAAAQQPESGPPAAAPSATRSARCPTPTDPASAPSVSKAGDKARVRPEKFIAVERTPDHWPKKHEPGSLENGMSVWYRDERYWIIDAPKDWSQTSFVRICDKFVRPGLMPDKDTTFCVPADLLEIAPVRRNALADQPTKSALETAARKKAAGITDVGDAIGELLRGKSLDEVYRIAGQRLRVPVPELLAKYSKLNHGQQRMTLGNRLRAQAKKEAA